MNQSRKLIGFYFALLVAVFNASGVSATESQYRYASPVQEDSGSDGAIAAPQIHLLWASEELFQQVRIPEYSQTQFLGMPFLRYEYRYILLQPDCKEAVVPERDLKTLLSSLIFPAHFFL